MCGGSPDGKGLWSPAEAECWATGSPTDGGAITWSSRSLGPQKAGMSRATIQKCSAISWPISHLRRQVPHVVLLLKLR